MGTEDNMHQVHIDRRQSLIKENMARIGRKLLVMSNKGGVGKSSVAAAFAALLSSSGQRTGLLDIDIHGPSMARLTGKGGVPPASDGKFLDPVPVRENLSMISMGSLLGKAGTPVIWRGPMKLNVLRQFLADVRWGDLDWLVIDAPPGTGDEPLSLCQMVPDVEAVVVTTGQEVALLDSVKAVNFLKTIPVKVSGILENMGAFACPHCSGQVDLFRSGGGERAAREAGVPFLGAVPFDHELLSSGEKGELYPLAHPDRPAALSLKAALARLREAR
jgi:Mrp family chromosome partitioning ATPase